MKENPSVRKMDKTMRVCTLNHKYLNNRKHSGGSEISVEESFNVPVFVKITTETDIERVIVTFFHQ